MYRAEQTSLILSWLAFSWLAMQGVHELGHVVLAWASGGEVERVVLHPLAISRTDVSPNPRPLVVAAGGAVVGCLLPLAAWVLVRRFARRVAFLAAFFAGFCLVANGAYLGVGSFAPGAHDAADMIRHGAARWQLLAFALPAMVAGLWMWNGLGPSFGLGPAGGKVDRRATLVAVVALVLIVVAEMAVNAVWPTGV